MRSRAETSVWSAQNNSNVRIREVTLWQVFFFFFFKSCKKFHQTGLSESIWNNQHEWRTSSSLNKEIWNIKPGVHLNDTMQCYVTKKRKEKKGPCLVVLSFQGWNFSQVLQVQTLKSRCYTTDDLISLCSLSRGSASIIFLFERKHRFILRKSVFSNPFVGRNDRMYNNLQS